MQTSSLNECDADTWRPTLFLLLLLLLLHPSCWRNSQPSLQVARQPGPAEHVFSSPGRVKVRSFIHSRWYSGPACLSCAAPSQQMMNSTQPIDRERDGRETRRERPPSDASLPSPFATQSVTCAVLRGGGNCICHFFFFLRCSSRGWFWTLTAKLWNFFWGSGELRENIFRVTMYTGYSRFKESLDFNNVGKSGCF